MPPRGASTKDKRQYEHIKESYKERGVGEDEAERRAAATVNKERSSEGRTKEPQSKAKQERSQRSQERAASRSAQGKSRTENARASTKRAKD
ncbi:MAG TPA: plasmid stabilization protein [bacterium]|nr:plasmid stabilization protein [bacterium]